MRSFVPIMQIIFILCIYPYLCQSNRLTYNQNHSTITVFTQNKQPLIMQIDYKTNKIHLSSQLQENFQYFYLDKNSKNKISVKPNIQQDSDNLQHQQNNILFDFEQYQKKFDDLKVVKIFGKIGLQPEMNTFLQIVKNANDQSNIKLKIDPQSNQMQILYQQCTNRIQFPLYMKVFGMRQQNVQLKHISGHFIPDAQFVTRILGKQKQKFNLSHKQMQQNKIKMEINAIVKKVSYLKLLSPICHYIPSTNSYQCITKNHHVQNSNSQKHKKNQNHHQQQNNLSELLMFYSIAICENGIQIEGDFNQAEDDYCVLHYILIVGSIFIGLVYVNHEIVLRVIKKMLRKKKGY